MWETECLKYEDDVKEMKEVTERHNIIAISCSKIYRNHCDKAIRQLARVDKICFHTNSLFVFLYLAVLSNFIQLGHL
jgi:hypothetical protein